MLYSVIESYDYSGHSFLLQYLNTQKCQNALAITLTKLWPEYLEMIFDKKPTGTEAKWLVGYLKSVEVETIPNHELLLEVLSEQTSLFIVEDDKETTINALEIIDHFYLEVSNLPSLVDTPKALEKIVDGAQFEISLEAIHFVLLHFLNVNHEAVRKSTYLTLRHSALNRVIEKVDEKINLYVEKVMLANPENTLESEGAFLSIVNNNKLSDKLRKAVIKQQEHVFSSLHQVAYGANHFFNYRKVTATWELLEDFHKSEMIEPDDLLYFINDETVIETLTYDNNASQKDKISPSLKQLLLNANELADDFYIKLALFLIKDKLASWPEISDEKRKGIIENNKIVLDISTFEAIQHMPLCVAKLLDSDPESYLANIERYPDLSDADISAIILLAKSEKLVNQALVTLPNYNIDSLKIGHGFLSERYLSLPNDKQSIDIISQLIERCRKPETLIKLLEKYLDLTNKEEYMEVLISVGQSFSKEQMHIAFSVLPNGPFRELLDNSKRPAFSKTDLNTKILNLLVQMKILKGYHDEGTKFRVRKHRIWASDL